MQQEIETTRSGKVPGRAPAKRAGEPGPGAVDDTPDEHRPEVARRRRGAIAAAERILAEDPEQPRHLSWILDALRAEGFTNSYQSLSGCLQLMAKAGKRFKKVGPSTYALLHPPLRQPAEQERPAPELDGGGDEH